MLKADLGTVFHGHDLTLVLKINYNNHHTNVFIIFFPTIDTNAAAVYAN